MVTKSDWYYTLYAATPEEIERCEAAWKRIKGSDGGMDAYQKTGTCKLCGAACWDNFLVCGDCDKKAPPAAKVSVSGDVATITDLTSGDSWECPLERSS